MTAISHSLGLLRPIDFKILVCLLYAAEAPSRGFHNFVPDQRIRPRGLPAADWSIIKPIRGGLEIKRNRCPSTVNLRALSLPEKHSTSTEIVDPNPDRNSGQTERSQR